MTYVLGAVLGVILGGAAGLLKKRFIWGDYLERDDVDGEASALYTRMIFSNLANVATLAAAFFLREVQPFNAMAFLIGTAFALVLLNRTAMTGKKKTDGRKEVL